MFGQVGDHLGPHPGRRGREGGLELGHRSIPSSAVSFSDSRRKNAPVPISTRKLRLVRPASIGGDPRVVSPPLGHGRDHRTEFAIEAHGARP